jgi:type VI secretion system protein ImpA
MPFREDLLNPIPGANPSGISLRYDPVTDKIKEARREDVEAPQGAWKSALKVADYGQVIQLASEAIAKRGKDLQVAVWLVDAHVRREGFSALAPGFRFLHGLLEGFWDTLYPEIEDGDAEVRAATLEWLGSKLPDPLRTLPITSNKLSWNAYKDSRTVGYESEAGTEEKQTLRQQLIEEGKPAAEDFDQAIDETPKEFYERLHAAFDDSLAALGSLIELCDARFGDVSPSFVKTRAAIEEIDHLVQTFITKKGGATEAAATPEETPVEEAAPAAATELAAAAAPARATGGGIEPSSPEDAARRLAAIARYLRQQDQYHIGPYLILRGLRWGEIRYNGPEIDASMLEPPSAELRKQLKQAATEGDWDKVLETAETAMEQPCGRGWLDAQRYAVKALENKGDWFRFVAGAVRTELRGLLTDLPGLLEMTLADDTPAANPETQAWIRREILPQAEARGMEETPAAEAAEEAPAEESATISADTEPPPMDEESAIPVPDVFDTALEAARQGRVPEAIQMLTTALDHERSGRGRFKRRMQLAHLFMASGHEKIAYPILEGLSEEMERRGLEGWEPGDVLAYPLVLLWKCLSATKGSDEKKQAVYARICRIYPEGALNCT